MHANNDHATASIAFQQLAETTQEVLRLQAKKQEAGLTPEENNLFDLNRVLLQLHLRQLDVRLLRKRSHAQSSSSSTSFSSSSYSPSSATSSPASSLPSSPASSALFQGVTTGYQKRVKRVFDGRVCGRCGTAYTSQWRTGPHGPSTLCNACGIRHFRQRKRDARRGKCAAAASYDEGRPTHTDCAAGVGPEVDGVVAPTPTPPAEEPARRGSIQFVLN